MSKFIKIMSHVNDDMSWLKDGNHRHVYKDFIEFVHRHPSKGLNNLEDFLMVH